SGRLSDYYIECSATTTHGPAMPLVGQVIHGRVPPAAVAIGGPTMGADPLAAAVGDYSAGTSPPPCGVSARKDAKGHGAPRWLEGSAQSGDPVVVVEDVITSGGSVIEAVRKCGEEGLRVLRAVVLVDREEDDGRVRVEAALAEIGADFDAIFTRSQIERAWHEARR